MLIHHKTRILCSGVDTTNQHCLHPKRKMKGQKNDATIKKCMHEELPQVSDAMTRAIICDNEPTSDKNE